MAGEASWAITLPNQFEPYGNILQRGVDAKNEQNQMLYSQQLREQQRAEQDEWKKLNLIQDLTNLDKHQTGSDVANAIGNKQAADIVQKYTQGASSMSPAELQAKITKDMSGIVSSMDALKSELAMSDEYLKALKTTYPGLDIPRMAKDARADILNRRLKGSTFANPLEVAPSEISYDNPEFLSRYMTGNKALKDLILSRKGADKRSVLMGKQGDYTKFEGDMNMWQEPEYDETKVNSEGFYTGKAIPKFRIKTDTVSIGGNPVKVIRQDVFDNVVPKGSQEELEINAMARAAVGEDAYNNMSPTEKNYLRRKVFYDQVSNLDQSQLQATSNVRPQVTRVSVNNNTSKDPTPIDLREYKDVSGGKDVTDLFRGVKSTGLPNGNSLLAESVIFNPTTQMVTYKEYTDGQSATPKTVSLTKFFQDIKTLNPGTDMKHLEGLRKPITGSAPQNAPATSTYEIKGKKYTEQQLIDMGYTKDQIAPYKKN